MPKTELKEVIGCKKKFHVEVEPERVERELTTTFRKVRAELQIPGFRKGKAPESMIWKRFGKAVREEALGDMLPKILQEVFDEKNINPIGQPEIRDLNYEEGSPLSFTVSVEEIPDIDISGFEGLKVTKKIFTVTDEDVDKSLESLRLMHAKRNPVDREVRQGDIIVVNLQKLDSSGVPLIGEKIENHVLELDGESTPSPEFDRQVYGMKKDESKTVRFTYDESINNSDLVGTSEAYSVKIVQVIEKLVPELNDAFAQSLGEYESLADLYEKTREDLIWRVGFIAGQKLKADLINEFVKTYPFEVPNTMVDRIIQSELEKARASKKNQSFDEEAFRQEIRPEAVRSVQTFIIIDAVKEDKQIAVTREEMMVRIQKMADSSGMDVKEVRRTLIKDGRYDSIKEELTREKAYDWMIETADVTVETGPSRPRESSLIT